MPCGGIFPIKGSWVEKVEGSKHACYHCNKPRAGGSLANRLVMWPDHWAEEWDAPIHAECVAAFLKTEDGELMMRHGHEVAVVFKTDPGGALRRAVMTEVLQFTEKTGLKVPVDLCAADEENSDDAR